MNKPCVYDSSTGITRSRWYTMFNGWFIETIDPSLYIMTDVDEVVQHFPAGKKRTSLPDAGFIHYESWVLNHN